MVAVIEDDESYRVAVRRLLKSEGFRVQSFASAEEFLNSGQQQETGCLISDIRMPGMSGLDLQAKLVQPFQFWHLFPARGTPRRSNMHQHQLTFGILQALRFAVKV
jgi:CheY-like chemotaxis protein